MDKSFLLQLKDACLLMLWNLVYVLFIVPFSLWKNAVVRLAQQRQQKALSLTDIKTQWPFLTFLKRLIFEFVCDCVIALTPLLMVIGFITGCATDGFGMGLSYFIGFYYAFPLICSLVRDYLLVFLFLPFRKFLSWVYKPAQELDIIHSGSIKQ